MFCFKIFLLIPLIIELINATTEFNCTNYETKCCSDNCGTPICASNRECEQWFCNECYLGVANCHAKEYHNGRWGLVPNGKCQCPIRCLNYYNPVCAFSKGNYGLFSSDCTLEKINCETNDEWRQVDIGLCEQPDDCPHSCTKEYLPICGYNGKRYREFGNECLFHLANCKESYVWGVFYVGGCADCYNW